MKKLLLIISIILLITLIPVCSYNACANDLVIETDHVVPVEVRKLCEPKGEVAVFAYRYRNKMSQATMLVKLENDWNKTWSSIPLMPRSAYVDMQRIIRDAYRTDRDGEYIKECCTKDIEAAAAVNEITQCAYSLF